MVWLSLVSVSTLFFLININDSTAVQLQEIQEIFDCSNKTKNLTRMLFICNEIGQVDDTEIEKLVKKNP